MRGGPNAALLLNHPAPLNKGYHPINYNQPAVIGLSQTTVETLSTMSPFYPAHAPNNWRTTRQKKKNAQYGTERDGAIQISCLSEKDNSRRFVSW